MAKAKPSGISDQRLKQYAEIVNTLESIELKGASMPYTSLNGNMFSFLSPDGALNLRLSAELREKVIAEHKTTLAGQHGTVLKEYVVIPESLLSDKRKMGSLLRSSYEYTSTLKPKPSKRK